MENNQQKRRKFGFNIIDVVIIIAVLALVCAFLLRGKDGKNMKGVVTDSKIEYTVKISSIQKESKNAVKAGDALYYSENNNLLGTVTDVKSDKALVYISYDTGEVKPITLDERIDMTLTVETTGKSDESGNYIGGSMFIAPGKELHAYTKNIDFVCIVMSVTPVE